MRHKSKQERHEEAEFKMSDNYFGPKAIIIRAKPNHAFTQMNSHNIKIN